jgi:hypothetical protein
MICAYCHGAHERRQPSGAPLSFCSRECEQKSGERAATAHRRDELVAMAMARETGEAILFYDVWVGCGGRGRNLAVACPDGRIVHGHTGMDGGATADDGESGDIIRSALQRHPVA